MNKQLHLGPGRRSFVPVLVLPDAEPFDQILGALKFGVKTVLLTFEPGNILHRHTEDREMLPK